MRNSDIVPCVARLPPGRDGGNDLRDHTQCRQDNETNTDLSPLSRIVRQERRLPSEAISFHGRLLDRVASPTGLVPALSLQLVIVYVDSSSRSCASVCAALRNSSKVSRTIR